MTEKQRKYIEDGVKELVLKDATAIDAIAKNANINQDIVYAFYLQFHRKIFDEMQASKPMHSTLGS